MKIELTEKEIGTLYHLVKGKRDQYGRIEQQFLDSLIDYCRTLNALKNKLNKHRKK
jgi:hypothetical protein